MSALAFLGTSSGCYDWALPLDDSGIDADSDTDGDGDSDTDGDLEEDSDIDIVEEPVITGIDGSGPLGEIVPREEDRAAWDDHAGDREDASHRIDTSLEQPELIIRGRNLADTERVVAERIVGSGSLEFDIMESDMEMVRVRFRPTSIVSGGFVPVDLDLSGRFG
jgi:hypothetical protein